MATGQIRQITDNTVPDYAPNWICHSTTLVFTSSVLGQPDVYSVSALPIEAGPVDVATEAQRLTFTDANDVYPRSLPVTEDRLLFALINAQKGTERIVEID